MGLIVTNLRRPAWRVVKFCNGHGTADQGGQERGELIKIGAKVVTHARYVIFQMAEVAIPRKLFAAILNRIQRLGAGPPMVQRG